MTNEKPWLVVLHISSFSRRGEIAETSVCIQTKNGSSERGREGLSRLVRNYWRAIRSNKVRVSGVVELFRREARIQRGLALVFFNQSFQLNLPDALGRAGQEEDRRAHRETSQVIGDDVVAKYGRHFGVSGLGMPERLPHLFAQPDFG